MSLHKTIIIFTVVISILITTVNAENYSDQSLVPAEVKSLIVKELPHSRLTVLDNSKDNMDNADKDYSLNNIYKYYDLVGDISDSQINFNNLFENVGFIFPIKFNNKVVAMTTVDYWNGKWKVFNITETDILGDTLFEAERISDNIMKNENIVDKMLLQDIRSGLYALAIKTTTNEYIIPLSDCNSFHLEKLKLTNINEIKDKVKVYYKRIKENANSKKATGAAPSTKQDFTKLSVLIITGGILLVILGVFLWIRKKKKIKATLDDSSITK